jgi:hypothetical protein
MTEVLGQNMEMGFGKFAWKSEIDKPNCAATHHGIARVLEKKFKGLLESVSRPRTFACRTVNQTGDCLPGIAGVQTSPNGMRPPVGVQSDEEDLWIAVRFLNIGGRSGVGR